MSICILASMLCLPAFAAEPAADVVLRVSALKKDGSTVVIEDYKSFEDGWNTAMGLAKDHKMMKAKGYDRVVVDLCADWTAVDGVFADDNDGFENDTIYFPEETRVTLNLNGHTINRAMTEWEWSGEVMYVEVDADVIINGGTITGGWSGNGAGGINIMDDAKVTLNNVHVDGNSADDDDGAAIALYDGATLIMNGGSLNNNSLIGTAGGGESNGGGIYAEKSTVVLDGVEIKNCQTYNDSAAGVAIYASDSDVTVNNCTFEANGIENADKDIDNPGSVIYSEDGMLTVTNSTFKNNGAECLFYAEDSEIFVDGTKVMGNSSEILFCLEDTVADITNTTITDNTSVTFYVDNGDELVTMMACTLGNNTPAEEVPDVEIENEDTFIVIDCILGDTTFEDEDFVKVEYSDVTKEDAKIGVRTLLADGTVVSTVYHRFFEYGWNLAIEAALTGEYDRVVVDLYGDWNAVDGEFTDDFNNGAGFNWDAIYIPQDVRITLNMNGYTIDRGLTTNERNGEVIYIDKNADVIINDGTITGGYSHNGAGGIHVMNNANVTLNNVHVDGNWVEDDDGAAIALYDATLIMNGGSISNNVFHNSQWFYGESYGTLYLNDSTAVLTDVEISGNGTCGTGFVRGVGMFLDDSCVTMKNCYVANNGYAGGPDKFNAAGTVIVISGTESVLDITDSKFENNGAERSNSNYLLKIEGGAVKVAGSEFLNNELRNVVFCEKGSLEFTDCLFKDNAGGVFIGAANVGSHFTNCTFSGNAVKRDANAFDFYEGNQLDFKTCDLGDSTYNDRSRATFDGSAGVGSIFGKGSFTTIVACVALIASVGAIVANISSKKKAVPATPNNTAEAETEEEDNE